MTLYEIAIILFERGMMKLLFFPIPFYKDLKKGFPPKKVSFELTERHAGNFSVFLLLLVWPKLFWEGKKTEHQKDFLCIQKCWGSKNMNLKKKVCCLVIFFCSCKIEILDLIFWNKGILRWWQGKVHGSIIGKIYLYF